MRRAWAKLGGQLGLACIGIGLLLIGLAWNGAAGVDFVQGQIPYLLSGGFMGLSLVFIGIGLVIVENSRKDRSKLQAELQDLNTAITRLAAAISAGSGTNGSTRTTTSAPPVPTALDRVVLGRTSYHRPDCRLAEGKELVESTMEAAEAEGLTPCRICVPDSSSAQIGLA